MALWIWIVILVVALYIGGALTVYFNNQSIEKKNSYQGVAVNFTEGNPWYSWFGLLDYTVPMKWDGLTLTAA